jgi:hypothetical protein
MKIFLIDEYYMKKKQADEDIELRKRQFGN